MVYGRVCADLSFRLRSDVLDTVARAFVYRLVWRALSTPRSPEYVRSVDG